MEYEATGEVLVDLGSDQTSCHNPFQGGYYPVQISYQEAREMMHQDPVNFKVLVQERLKKNLNTLNTCSSYFNKIDLILKYSHIFKS